MLAKSGNEVIAPTAIPDQSFRNSDNLKKPEIKWFNFRQRSAASSSATPTH
jgi:hypothetical protein